MLYPDDITDPPRCSGTARLAVLASGSGSNFAAIADAIDDDRIDGEIVGVVYNNPGAFVAQRAASRGLKASLIDHREFDSRSTFDAAVVAELRAFGAEWVIMAGWMRIATPTLLDAFKDRILNIHPALLPSFRGMHAVEQAIEAGVRIAGCSVHFVNEGVDEGRIVAQAAVPVHRDDTAETLHARIHKAEHFLYPRAIQVAIAQTISKPA